MSNLLDPAAWPAACIAMIEFVGALLIVGHCAAALAGLARSRDPVKARLLVIEGSLWGLSLKTAASLLKTLEIHTWAQIGAFAAILALRTLVKRTMTWERARLTRHQAEPGLSPAARWPRAASPG